AARGTAARDHGSRDGLHAGRRRVPVRNPRAVLLGRLRPARAASGRRLAAARSWPEQRRRTAGSTRAPSAGAGRALGEPVLGRSLPPAPGKAKPAGHFRRLRPDQARSTRPPVVLGAQGYATGRAWRAASQLPRIPAPP